MISHTTIQVIGLVLTVYGLEEYKALCSDTPVSILFALHGRLGNQSKMKPLSEALCSINPNKNRHLIVITFDSPNHGSRLINETANYAWKGERIENPNHAVDMWSMVYSTANTVSELIDVIEHYLFGPHNKSRVEIWGVAGFSMGGHAAYIAGANDPRISVVIPIVGISDYLSLMKQRLKKSGLPEEVYLTQYIQSLITSRTSGLDVKLKNKHLLIMDTEKDPVVKTEFNQPLINSLRVIHSGKEGVDWNYHLIKNVGHEWCPFMINMSIEWCRRWM